MFQFQKVRLKEKSSRKARRVFGVSIPKGAIKSRKCRFRRRRLCVSIPKGAIKSLWPFPASRYHFKFQFQKVRLKAYLAVVCNKNTSVSIPKGAIKRSKAMPVACFSVMFQFQKVRLKAQERRKRSPYRMCFNSKRCD